MNYAQTTINRLKELLPNCDNLLVMLYAQLAHTTGSLTSLQDIHEAWSFWCNTTRPDHRSLIEFYKLSPEVQELDRKYMNVVRQVAREVAVSEFDRAFGK
jgi:hypothetical protein